MVKMVKDFNTTKTYMTWLLGVGWGFLLAFLDVFSILADAPEKNAAFKVYDLSYLQMNVTVFPLTGQIFFHDCYGGVEMLY